MKPLPTDRAQKLLRLLGWSFGDMSYRDRAGLIWQVTARRDDEWIVARAPSQSDAWDEALRQAEKVQRSA